MITIRDIHRRLKLLPESSTVGNHYLQYLDKANAAITSKDPYKIMKMIEFAINESSNSFTIETVTDLYDALYECGNEHNLKQYSKMIAEDYVAKVRNAKETQSYLRRKIGRIKTAASTKANTNVEEIQNAVKQAIDKLKGNFKNNTNAIKNNVNKGLHRNANKPKASKTKTEAFIDGYDLMIESSTKMIYCDRILNNYNRISKRFNIDRIIQENIYANGIDDTIAYICRLVETYDAPDKVKYNTVLETLWYGFNKNYVDCKPSRYVTLATDYFMAKGGNRDMCATLLEASMVVKRDDYDGDLEFITEEEPEDDNEPMTPKYESMAIQDQIRNYVVKNSKVNSIRLNEDVNFNKIFNDFKKSDDKNKENRLQWLVRRLYTKNPNDIVKGTPTLFNYIRLVFILGTAAIHPVLLAVSAISDIFISLHMQRTETEKMLKCFKNEIDESKRKLKNTTDPEEKARLKQYISALQKGYEKIDEYYDDKLTDAELDRKYDSDSDAQDSFENIKKQITDDDDDDDNSSGNDDFDDFDDFDDMDDDDDFDMNFDESYIGINNIGLISEKYSEFPYTSFDREMIETIVKTAPMVCNELVDISLKYPDILDPDTLHEVVSKCIKLDESKIPNFVLSEAESKLEYSNIAAIKNDTDNITYTANVFSEQVEILEGLNDILNSCYYYNPLVESSFTNSIKLAADKVRRAMVKMSDKEKEISKNIDVAANNTKKAMENALSNNNRESIIKGSILPSASKTIKLAITSVGLGILIDPALAVITALGYLGVSKFQRAKERQMIIDEIEIELKMCEKYIEIAESKNDMKALKKLLTIQRELERQRQRIKYNMKVKFGQKYYDTKDAPPNTANMD